MPARALPPPDPNAMADLAALALAMGPDELEGWAASLPPDDQRLLERALAGAYAVGWRADPARMAAHFDRTFKLYRYVQLLSARFVDAIEGRRPRQLWALPGRMGKTTLLQWGLTWALDRNPAGRSIFTSYGDDLALETGAAVRDQLEAHADELRARLRRDRRARDRWLTPQGGGLLAAGIKTGITGYGASPGGVLVVDDPFKGWQEAHRASERADVVARFKGTLRNRLDDEAVPIIVVHHRLHTDDLIGVLQAEAEDETGEAYDTLALPALAVADKPDPLGRAPGEVIEPERFDAVAVASRHRGIGSSYLVSALEQQDPRPAEGTELLREWFVLAPSGDLPHAPDLAITSWDLKLKDREAGDYVVGQCWWRVAGGFWLLDQLRGQYDHATTACAIALLSVRHPEARTHIVEAAGSHDEVLPQLRKPQPDYVVSDAMAERLGMSPTEREQVGELRRRGMAGLVPHPPVGDKSVRARAYIAPNAEPGHVRMPADAPWVPALLDEVAGFPKWANDDQVDAMSQALQRLAKGGAKASAPKGSAVPSPQPGAHRQAVVQARPAQRARVSAPGARRRLR